MYQFAKFAIVLVSLLVILPSSNADTIPTLEEIRDTIDAQAKEISHGKYVGYSYNVQRHFNYFVPKEALPEGRVQQEESTGVVREIFLRQEDKRAISSQLDGKEKRMSMVQTWDGKNFQVYEPSRWSSNIRPGNLSNQPIDDVFSRLQGPFAWGLLPIDFDTAGDCLQGKFHDQQDLRVILSRPDVKVLDKTEQLDDSKCVVIANESGPFLWLDLNRDYVVKQYMNYADHYNGINRYHYYNEKFTKVIDGLWAIEQGFLLLRGPGINYEFTSTQDYLAQIKMYYTDIRFAEPFKEDVFKINLPPGTSVYDATIEGSAFQRNKTIGFAPEREK